MSFQTRVDQPHPSFLCGRRAATFCRATTVLTACQSCLNCISPCKLYVNRHPSPFPRPLLQKVFHQIHEFDIFNPQKVHNHPFDWTCKCTGTLGADVTKFKSVQNTNFGREGIQLLVKTTKVTLNAKSIWTRWLLCSKQANFCDQLIFISLKALCYSYHQCRRSRRRR